MTVEERTTFNTPRHSWRSFATWAWRRGCSRRAAGRYELILSHYSPGRTTEVQELLGLLELKGDPARESMIRTPVVLGVREADFDGLAVQTRSVAEIMLTTAASIEVPSEDVAAASWKRGRTL